MSAYLELDGVSKIFAENAGVQPTDLAIDQGEMLVLLGPSGCGKTTLLNMVAGLLEPDTGSIRIAGHDVTRVPTHRRDISMVFQTWALFPHMTVEQNIAFGLRMRGVAKPERDRRVGEVLELVQLEHLRKRKPGQLSGGQQQRIALARAVVTRPKVLLLDEPLSSLDYKIRLGLRRELRQLQRELGLTGVYVTHDHSEALALGDRIAVMQTGTVVESGEPREVFARPSRRYTAEFLSIGKVLELVPGPGGRTTSVGVPLAAPDDSVAVCLRPTSVALAPAAGTTAAGTSRHEAEIVGVEFEPAGVTYSFRLDNGTTLEGFDADLTPRPLGERTTISVRWSDAVYLAA
jgi:ABC-type Fe3+/spermidine/putrescine transport system ATPase subunit